MSRTIIHPEFHGEKNVQYFLKLCKKAEFVGVKWNKFKKLDKKEKGLFQDFSKVSLSLHFRRLHYAELGMCWQCTIEEAVKSGYCQTCYDRIQEKTYSDRGGI